MAPTKKLAPPGPEPLIRLAFKEGDLRKIIDFMTAKHASDEPEIAQQYHRLLMRLSEFQSKQLRVRPPTKRSA